MADDTNIDDILKSIDALLKEGEDEDARSGKQKAINDEDIAADVEDVPAGISRNEDVLPHRDEERPDEESQGEEHQDDIQQQADATDMDDHPTNLPTEADVEDRIESPEPQADARRIVLSEDMLVEGTPDLPLTFAEGDGQADEQADEDEQTEGDEQTWEADEVEFAAGEDFAAADIEEEGVAEECAVEEDVAEEEDAGPPQAQALHVPPGDAVDTERLIEQIAAEISTRLQESLPGLVADAVRRHIAAQADASGTETDDAADADGD